jgi:TatA/E family protein of Tat protein translocase
LRRGASDQAPLLQGPEDGTNGPTSQCCPWKIGLENPVHIALVLLVVLLVFGAKRLPGVGRGLGRGMREFKESVSGVGADRSLPPAAADHSDEASA